MAAPLPPAEVNLDLDRATRTGLPEHIYCASKSLDQLRTILGQVTAHQSPLLLTKLDEKAAAALSSSFEILYDVSSKTATFQWTAKTRTSGRVAVVCAGSSDVPVARECARTLRFHHEEALEVADVGVAGLHRLLARVAELEHYRVVVAVAGMDAALVSVLGGLVPGLVIAVPTSVGYGAARGGETALSASLVSCASGVVVVNIDNGYGAACAALRVLHAFA
ncbi:MAG: nickel pincer cofactor biosynthesis protein LarB [Deltaproteobacteria bacterium]|nr:nickel pincer cofactor biosynthesis protein LarB [Deltaproteobacteria bacterium]